MDRVFGDPDRTGKYNDRLLALARRSRGRFLAIGSVQPADRAQALEEVERRGGRGARALKLQPNTQGFDVADPKVKEGVVRPARAHLPVLLDAYSPFDPARPGRVNRLSLEVPESRLILAHGHGP